jgi:uncharacterized protein YaiE (UPF0345 family)
MSSNRFDHVSVCKKASISYEGQCVSYTLLFPDETKKVIGVMMPGPQMKFVTDVAEVIDIIEGKCRASIGLDGEWKDYEAGQHFRVPGKSSFDIQAQEMVQYVCHFRNQ